MAKVLRVSPFMPMDLDHRVSCGVPGERCTVRFELWQAGERYVDIDLWCTRTSALDRRGLRRLTRPYPLVPLVVSASIYLDAARLLLMRVPSHPHPARDRATTAARPARAGARDVA